MKIASLASRSERGASDDPDPGVMEAPIDEPEEIIQWVNWGFMLTAIPIVKKFTEEMQMNLKADWVEMYN